MIIKKRYGLLLLLFALMQFDVHGQQKPAIATAKKISPDLFGIFFEDLSYAADGGLYAELVQNRSFEYSPADNRDWNSLTAWKYQTDGFGYGTISVETAKPIHPNNSHYILLNIDDAGQKGVGLENSGFDGIPVQAGKYYNFSVFLNVLSPQALPVSVSLIDKKGKELGTASFTASQKGWNKYSEKIKVNFDEDSAKLVLLVKSTGKIGIDMVSLFPAETFKGHENGMRADLAQTIAAVKPKFMRFPGGCLVHGDGVANIYRWKNTIGPLEQRVEQRDIWNYHQSVGLGYYEYFRFCEDIGAKPVPVLAAGVSCQNSGGTWKIGSTGQKGIPMEEMGAYIQDILDLIEYANGPVSSTWGAKRAAAGHPAPFNLEYLGIGNEDKITGLFEERFRLIYDAVRKAHPEIRIIGTVGPSPAGDDFENGWKLADLLSVGIVDEHYYEKPEWFLKNTHRYDHYNRLHSKVYIGEYASWGNTLFNAVSEAVYMTNLERNGDVVQMASYAPLIARIGHTSWNPNLIYFNGKQVFPTVNYYVQQQFAVNSGSEYLPAVMSFKDKALTDSIAGASCVRDAATGDIILKIANAGPASLSGTADLSKLGKLSKSAAITVITGDPKATNTIAHPTAIVPKTIPITLKKHWDFTVPAYSLTVVRIKGYRVSKSQ
ncbi:alpha-L-arabinofuranosidase C-terminal domain-containing protein [Mucilaginibacter flavus]|uniref:alpha-L-arabinofuranosidase C-terminal domain-containing protein n=1 Tax=Mucilaginibacter flavus TaxID=931504 RepID=UPI0025B4899B|nr:alpha-L-arabinofuranosidase C-terminal domain-containing protein [Mucilaginibacter flavus]MDN3582413.1 alpha-L-arabinofuranosidase C-terminal domain-containing protein [Mucilaginibacter flavus]